MTIDVVQAIAPGKVILLGEHAVVYGRPAIAIPVTEVQATACVTSSPGPGITIKATNLGKVFSLDSARMGNPLARAVKLVLAEANLSEQPDIEIELHSTIPVAGGMGSGAATAAAVIRALAQYLQIAELSSDEGVSRPTYEVEKIHHGTPSGIDNSVVSFGQPIYFQKSADGGVVEPLDAAVELQFLVADSGVRGRTIDVVAAVRLLWDEEPQRLEGLFDECGRCAREGRVAITNGDIEQLGSLMSDNHRALQQMTVSAVFLDRLASAATSAGAAGAKMSGGGRGGNVIALVRPERATQVRAALFEAGAKAIYGANVAANTGRLRGLD